MKPILIHGLIACIAAFSLSCYSGPQTDEAIQDTAKDTIQDSAMDMAGQQKDDMEVITPVVEKKATEPAQTGLEKRYRVEGKSAAGRDYNGMVFLVKKGNDYNLTMTLKSRVIRGTGSLDGNRFVVYWGKNRRFEYEVKDDGVIRSLWDKGEESFIPVSK